MEKIQWKNNEPPAISAENLMQMQNNIDNGKEDKIEVVTNDNGTAIKFANGQMIQYGRKKWSKGESYTTINLPVPFIDMNYVLTAINTYNQTTSQRMYINSNFDGSHNTVYRRWSYLDWSDSGHSTLYQTGGDMPWIAIGKWK